MAWGRIVTYIGERSGWEPRYAIAQRRDGPLVTERLRPELPVVFDTVEEAAEWARENHYTHLECDQLLGWKG